MIDLKKLKKDLEQLHSKTQDALKLNKRILDDINHILWTIDEDEETSK